MGYKISCGGHLNSFGDCVEKAGEMCGASGYKVVGANGEETGYSQANGSWGSLGGSFNAQNTSFVSRELFVKCNK